MSELYELVTESSPPVSLADMKIHLKIDASITADDALITSLIGACTEFGEGYTGRSFRAQTFNLLIDAFASRICIRRSPVDAITYINYLVSGSPVAVDSSIYYLKKGEWDSEIILKAGEDWPDDIDEQEQAIEIQFTTVGYTKKAALMLDALKLHVNYLYHNRGDADERLGVTDMNDTAIKSGATTLYNMFRVVPV